MNGTIAEMFESYLKSAYPSDWYRLPDSQLREVRRAFYAGVRGGTTAVYDSDGQPPHGYEEELETFKNSVLNDKA